jgi:hypothetical protein
LENLNSKLDLNSKIDEGSAGKKSPEESINVTAKTEPGVASKDVETLSWQKLITFRRKKFNEKESRLQYMEEENLVKTEQSSVRNPLRHDINDISEKGQVTVSIFRAEDKGGLYDAFREICPRDGYEDISVDERRIKIRNPIPLLHYMNALETLKERVSKEGPASGRLYQEVDALLNLCRYPQGPIFKAHRAARELMETNCIDFENIRAPFRLGQLVLLKELRDQWVVRRVTRLSVLTVNRNTDKEEFPITCESIGFDGRKFQYVTHQTSIEYFAGIRDITELSVYPLEKLPDRKRKDIIDQLIVRGNHWYSLHLSLIDEKLRQRSQLKEYRGYCEGFDEDDDDDDRIVSEASFHSINPKKPCTSNLSTDCKPRHR